MNLRPVETVLVEGRIMLRAKVWAESEDNFVEELFLFDTGSDGIFLPKKALEKIGAKEVRKYTAESFGGNIVDVVEHKVNIRCGMDTSVYGIIAGSSDSEDDYLIGMSFVNALEAGFFFNGTSLFWVK